MPKGNVQTRWLQATLRAVMRTDKPVPGIPNGRRRCVTLQERVSGIVKRKCRSDSLAGSATKMVDSFRNVGSKTKGRVNEAHCKEWSFATREWTQNGGRGGRGPGNERTRAGRAGLRAGAMWTVDVGTFGHGALVLKAAHSWIFNAHPPGPIMHGATLIWERYLASA